MNEKDNDSGTNLTNPSYDEDNCCHYTDELHLSAELDESTQVLDEQPIRVREMINLYNFATKQNQELEHAKLLYFKDMKAAQEHQQQQEQLLLLGEDSCSGGGGIGIGSIGSGTGLCIKMSNMEHTADVDVGGGVDGVHSSSKMASTFRLTTTDDKSSPHQSMHSDCADGITGEGEAIEKSYQSRTTIRRTEQGVRIIIDIFFDKKESELDIVGSRVETDIPESRILTEFQKLSLGMRPQQLNEATHV